MNLVALLSCMAERKIDRKKTKQNKKQTKNKQDLKAAVVHIRSS